MPERLEDLELFAWVGEDEFGSGVIGLKQGRVPAGMIPLVATTQGKLDRTRIEQQMQAQAQEYGKRISLCRFVMAETIKYVE